MKTFRFLLAILIFAGGGVLSAAQQPKTTPDEHVDTAQRCLKKQMYAEAREEAQKALKINPDHAKAKRVLAILDGSTPEFPEWSTFARRAAVAREQFAAERAGGASASSSSVDKENGTRSRVIQAGGKSKQSDEKVWEINRLEYRRERIEVQVPDTSRPIETSGARRVPIIRRGIRPQSASP